MSLYMESTEIPAEKTAGEIAALLAMAGAQGCCERGASSNGSPSKNFDQTGNGRP